MGDKISRWWWGGNPDQKHEISGMTLKDVYNVQHSWKTINANPLDNGYLMFFRLFEVNPESKTFFKILDNARTETEMRDNVRFRAHVLNIMAALNNSIENLNKPEIVVVWMEKLGTAHRRSHVQERHFLIFKDVLVNILKNDLKLSEAVVKSWGRYVTFIYSYILPKLSS
uniref:Globin domain-containing protein n=1 Tax=Heliothis virescens TaxID=7102 RepID=A0A2A4JK54_HELVI